MGIVVKYFVFLLCSEKLEECTVYFLKIVNTPLKGGPIKFEMDRDSLPISNKGFG